MTTGKDPSGGSKGPPASNNPGNPPPPVSESPEWLVALHELLERIDPKDAEQALKDIEAFVEGEMTWAEVQGIPQQLLFDIAERGYLKFKGGRLQEAESLFRGLSMLDHKTAYFHTALGAIYQKQENYLDALAEYTVALELDPEDITALVNRGEVYYLVGYVDEPLQDFEGALRLDPEGKDPWGNRARFLKKRLEAELAEEKKAQEKKK